MKSIVIGGQGFLGAEIVRTLLSKGRTVTVADKYANGLKCEKLFGSGNVRVRKVDIMDVAEMRELTAGADSVYHLAGKLGTSELDDDVLNGIHVNIIGAVNVFAACVENGVPIVFYPAKPNIWLNTYSVTKFASEQFAQIYSTNGTTRICSLRYFNAFGPNQASMPVRKIIPSFAQQAIRGRPIEVFGSGDQVIDMIYSADIGRITVAYAEKTDSSVPLDCGRGIALTVNEIAHAVNDYFGNTAGITYLPMRRGETPDSQLVANIDPLRQMLGDLAFSDWETSLSTTLQWYADEETNLLRAAG